MIRFTRPVAVVLLALWGLATSHCLLERLDGFEFLACCQHADKAPHEDNDCDGDGCAVVESGLYLFEDNPALMPGLVYLTALSPWDFVVELPVDFNPSLSAASPVSSELPRFWQFHYRAALPPRAPSLVI